MSNEISLKNEIQMRKATAKTINDWKDNYDWAVYWILNFMDASNNLEKMFISEVGEQRYSDMLQEFMMNRGNSFYETFDLPVPDKCKPNIANSTAAGIEKNYNTGNAGNIIQFPFTKSK